MGASRQGEVDNLAREIILRGMRGLLIIGLTIIATAALAQSRKPDPLMDGIMIDQAEKTIAGMMKDPETVEFRNVVLKRYDPTTTALTGCGEMNAKNSFGAYVGYGPFVVSTNPNRILLPTQLSADATLWGTYCGN